ncbi:periplasmic copper-binding transport system protein [Neisseria animaloris]|uniref:nitrous oxide reductase family maturation protein NosD n=1 Tax=Neisseria animaloris TaxID=326522 RepID=UPI000A191E7C|nr:nitrous oxide reductase family maturation protein NosD [Neisseria animaloris]OSI07060.1 carbohydrate-binding protein [Neisseria animaloris]VEH88209.1 periplasmic copper-binding transport system protein [Neisseria animaloris]
MHTTAFTPPFPKTVLLITACGLFQTASAAVVNVAAGADLQQVINNAQAGDVLKLAAGGYRGKIVIDKPLTLEGPQDRSARIKGDRTGRTLSVHSPDVTVRNLTVTHSGLSLPAMDAGIFLDKSAARALVEHNNIFENSVGVYIWGANDALVRENKIVGDTELRLNERGNGVTVWNAPGSKVVGNDISEGRDGIYSNASTKNEFKNNRFSKLRYAVHYMYTNDSEVSGNFSDGNSIGYAIMFSERLKVKDNIAVNSRDQGLMLNYANHSEISGNVIDKADKCVFIYNANYNQISGNRFEGCKMGIHFTAAAEGNRFYGNSFVDNQSQVKYVGTRHIDWTDNGRGNYWSDNSAFDLDGDGIADTAYRPNGIIDQIVWRAPVARLLMNSPAVSIVKWAQSQFPAILPGGVTDSRPLMTPPQSETLKKYGNIKNKAV